MTLDTLQLETPRLLLRLPRAEDLDPWAEMMADETAAQFIGGVMPRAVSWRGLMTMIGAWHAHGFAMFSVIEKSTGRWVGRLGPWMPEGWPGTEVGWAIVRDCWGRGYATEGAVAATDWAFDELGWSRVIHCIAPANVASQGVARKLGSRHLGAGVLPPPFQESPVDIWGQSREEWRRQRDRAGMARQACLAVARARVLGERRLAPRARLRARALRRRPDLLPALVDFVDDSHELVVDPLFWPANEPPRRIALPPAFRHLRF